MVGGMDGGRDGWIDGRIGGWKDDRLALFHVILVNSDWQFYFLSTRWR